MLVPVPVPNYLYTKQQFEILKYNDYDVTTTEKIKISRRHEVK